MSCNRCKFASNMSEQNKYDYKTKKLKSSVINMKIKKSTTNNDIKEENIEPLFLYKITAFVLNLKNNNRLRVMHIISAYNSTNALTIFSKLYHNFDSTISTQKIGIATNQTHELIIL